MAIPESYPDAVRAALQRLVDSVATIAPLPASMAVFGSLVKGTYRAGSSEVSLAVVLADDSEQALVAVRKPLHTASQSLRLRPFLLSLAELPRLADVFPIKIADIVDHHDLIFGDDPFADVVVERAHLRLRIEQLLRDHLLRIRRHYIHGGDDAAEMTRAVFGSISALEVELTALLKIAGEGGGSGTLASVIEPAVAAFGLDRAMLDRLEAFRKGGKESDMRGLFFGLVSVLQQAVQIADELDV